MTVDLRSGVTSLSRPDGGGGPTKKNRKLRLGWTIQAWRYGKSDGIGPLADPDFQGKAVIFNTQAPIYISTTRSYFIRYGRFSDGYCECMGKI